MGRNSEWPHTPRQTKVREVWQSYLTTLGQTAQPSSWKRSLYICVKRPGSIRGVAAIGWAFSPPKQKLRHWQGMLAVSWV